MDCMDRKEKPLFINEKITQNICYLNNWLIFKYP